VEAAAPHFEAAHYQGIMAIYAHPARGRTVRLNYDNRAIVDFVRCSYLGLDNHPDIVSGAAEGVRSAGALHWSCARTRLNFSGLGDLERSRQIEDGAAVLDRASSSRTGRVDRTE
jgi:8-amino-7-oxononanoate synthase